MALSPVVLARMVKHSERTGDTVEQVMANALDSAMDWYYLAADARTDVCANRPVIGYGAYIWGAAAREIASRNEIAVQWLRSVTN